MAQTKRKKKHRGNAAGIVERPAHNARGTRTAAPKRPQTKDEKRAATRQARVEVWRPVRPRVSIVPAGVPRCLRWRFFFVLAT